MKKTGPSNRIKREQEAFEFIEAYEEAHQRERKSLHEELYAWEETLPEKLRFALLGLTRHSNTLARLVIHFDSNPDSDESFEERMKRTFAGKRILDIGARHGEWVKFLKDHGVNAEGIDVIKTLEPVYKKFGIPVRILHYKDLPANHAYDAITTRAFTETQPHHIGFNSKRLAKRIAGGLKPGGINVNYDAIYSRLRKKDLQAAGLKVTHYGSDGVMHLCVAHLPP